MLIKMLHLIYTLQWGCLSSKVVIQIASE